VEGNRPLIGLDGRCTRIELVRHVVVRGMWLVRVGKSHDENFRRVVS
jgi:hypothetical protein